MSDKWYTNLVLIGEVGSEIFSLLLIGTLKKRKTSQNDETNRYCYFLVRGILLGQYVFTRALLALY